MREFLAVANALADESRLRLLMGLQGRELCVCKLVDLVELSDSTVSRHMAILRQAGLVEARKRGRWVYYRLADDDASSLVHTALKFAQESLADSKQIRKDTARILEILSRDDGSACQTDPAACKSKTPALAAEAD